MGICQSGSVEDIVAVLKRTPFNYRLTAEELRTFASYFKLEKYSKGTVITTENDDECFFVIDTGTVDVSYEHQFLCSKGKGDFFGSIALNAASILERKETMSHNHMRADVYADGGKAKVLGSVPLTEREKEIAFSRLATVKATQTTTVIRLTRDAFSEYLDTVSVKLEEIINTTMGATTTKNLKSLPFLSSLSDKKIHILSNMLHYVPLRAGDTLFTEGSLGSELYIVYFGSLDAIARIVDEEAAPGDALTDNKSDSNKQGGSAAEKKKNADFLHAPTNATVLPQGNDQTENSKSVQAAEAAKKGQNVVLNTFKEGDFFGEISLIMNMPRTASIVAREDCVLLELRSDDFRNFLKLTPNLPFHDLMKRRFANHFKKYRVPFFAAIPDDKYPLLASLCHVEQYPKGEVIFAEGEVGDRFYIIAHGSVVVTTQRKNKRQDSKSRLSSVARKDTFGKSMPENEIELTRMGPGKYFGEIALIRKTQRTATVRTLERCVILSIRKEDFESFFEEAPEAVADFEVKLGRYDCAMRSIIYHPLGLQYFTQFLDREYSGENIRFWKTARDFRHIGLGPKNSVVQGTSSIPQDIELVFKTGPDAYADLGASLGVPSPAGAARPSVSGFEPSDMDSPDETTTEAAEEPLTVSPQFDRSSSGGVQGDGAAHSSLTVPGKQPEEEIKDDERKETSAKEDADKEARVRSGSARPRPTRWSLSKSVMADVGSDQSNMYQNSYQMSLKQWKEAREKQREEKKRNLPPEVKAELLAAAQHIVRRFIKQGAEEQVNINGDIRELIEARVAKGEVNHRTFVMAEKEILALVERDSFNRFKQSELFREFLQEAESYDEKAEHKQLQTASAQNDKIRSGSVIEREDERASEALRQIKNHRDAAAGLVDAAQIKVDVD